MVCIAVGAFQSESLLLKTMREETDDKECESDIESRFQNAKK
jgi:hypothetical protein